MPNAIRPPASACAGALALGLGLLTAATVTFLYTTQKNQLGLVQDFLNALFDIFRVDKDNQPDSKMVLFSLLTGILLPIPHLTTVARSLSEFVRDPSLRPPPIDGPRGHSSAT